MAAAAAQVPHKIREVKNVHQDDIHAILPLSDHTFVTGSKDGALKKWDLNGKLVKVIYDSRQINYKSWITALSSLGEGQWLSGTRDGYIHRWDAAGEELQEVRAPARDVQERKCKERNWQRVNCLADFTLGQPRQKFLAGWPTQFSIHPAPRFQSIGGVKTSENDWVYAVHPLRERSVLVVTGGQLDLLEGEGAEWRSSRLVKEGGKMNGQRPFISAITPLGSDQFGLSIFNGWIAVYNLETKKMVMSAREHTKRVWTIEPVGRSCFASCADDGLIKLWDIRVSKNSFATMQDRPEEPSRVSVLLSPNEHTLISGSCPDAVMESDTKATLSFWDLRRV